MNYRNIITIGPGKRGGRRCIRKMRIAVADVPGWFATGMSGPETYAELTEEDSRAGPAFAADRERRALKTECSRMKLLLDRNPSFRLCVRLADLFPGSRRGRPIVMGRIKKIDWMASAKGSAGVVAQRAAPSIAGTEGAVPCVEAERCSAVQGDV